MRRPLACSSGEVEFEGVWIVKPRLLDRFLGGLTGMMKDGDGGADCGSDVSGPVAVMTRNGGRGAGRVGPVMFNDRFLVFLALLPGEKG